MVVGTRIGGYGVIYIAYDDSQSIDCPVTCLFPDRGTCTVFYIIPHCMIYLTTHIKEGVLASYPLRFDLE